MSSECFQPLSCGEVCRILCVDDDPVSQRIVVAALARRGFAVECVCSGEEALTRFASDGRGFDVLVTDHVMPRMNGVELLRRLRQVGFEGRTIVVSAMISGGDVAAYAELGVEVFFQKPIDIAGLRAAVATAALVAPRGQGPSTDHSSAPKNVS